MGTRARSYFATVSLFTLMSVQVNESGLANLTQYLAPVADAATVSVSISGRARPKLDCGGGSYCNPNQHWQKEDSGQEGPVIAVTPGDTFRVTDLVGTITWGGGNAYCQGAVTNHASIPKLMPIVQFINAGGLVVGVPGGGCLRHEYGPYYGSPGRWNDRTSRCGVCLLLLAGFPLQRQ